MPRRPSLLHAGLAWAVPRLRGARDLDSEPAERARVERWHAGLRRDLPTRAVPGLARRHRVATGSTGGFPTHVVSPRSHVADRTVVYLHGGGYVAPTDPVHVRYAVGLADALGARVVLPDYPLAPEHTWRDSHEALVDLVAWWAERSPDGVVLAGDSAGGGLALAVAQTLRDRGGPAPTHLLLLSPWVDLTHEALEQAPRTVADDPWLQPLKLQAYAGWWAGDPADRDRPEVSPGLGDLDGLPPTLLLCGTRDLLHPGCAALARRAEQADWDLTFVEEPGLIHVYALLPLVPEARRAHRTVLRHLALDRAAGSPS